MYLLKQYLNCPLPVMGLPVWKVVLLGWMVYGAGFGLGSTPPCLGIISTQAEVGAPLGKDRTDVKTCSMTTPKNTASMIPETGFFNRSFAIVQCKTTNLYTLSQIMPWTIDFWKALLLSHNCIKNGYFMPTQHPAPPLRKVFTWCQVGRFSKGKKVFSFRNLSLIWTKKQRHPL